MSVFKKKKNEKVNLKTVKLTNSQMQTLITDKTRSGSIDSAYCFFSSTIQKKPGKRKKNSELTRVLFMNTTQVKIDE